MIGSIESRLPNCTLRNFPSRNILWRIMEGRKAICSCLVALACLQAIQQISATRKALLASILGDLKPSDCNSGYGIIGGNTESLPTSKLDLVAELLHIRRLLERGCSTLGSPLSGPLGGALNSPLSGPLGGALSSPLHGPLSGASSSLNGALGSPSDGALGTSVGGPLSSGSLGSGLNNFSPSVLHGRFSGLLHN